MHATSPCSVWAEHGPAGGRRRYEMHDDVLGEGKRPPFVLFDTKGLEKIPDRESSARCCTMQSFAATAGHDHMPSIDSITVECSALQRHCAECLLERPPRALPEAQSTKQCRCNPDR